MEITGLDRAEASRIIRGQTRQEQFLSSSADIVVYGGAAGGGKTYALLLEPVRHKDNPQFGSVIFRNTFRQIEQEGGLWDSSELIYPYLGAEPNLSRYWWTFPSGSRVRFGYLARDSDKYNYAGAQIPLLGYDQLEQIGESAFFFMLSRNRSMTGIAGYVRATCNPDADSWLARFLDWWIAEDGYADLSRVGRVRWFVRSGEDLVWSSDRAELERQFRGEPDVMPKSVTFILSTVYDNRIMLERDPSYLANLRALLPVDRERLLGHPTRGGNWKIRAGAGDIFNRNWFDTVSHIPPGGDACLFWDFASTEKQTTSDDPDYTAGVLMIHVGGTFYWADTITFRRGPGETMRRFRNRSRQIAAEMDRQNRRFLLRWEIEPGSAAKRENELLMQEFPELDAEGIRSTGDKLVRARPLAQAAYANSVKMLIAGWNEGVLNHLHNQPYAPHDDIMDAGAGAYGVLVGDIFPDPAGERVQTDVQGLLKPDSPEQVQDPDRVWTGQRTRTRIWGRGKSGRGMRRPMP